MLFKTSDIFKKIQGIPLFKRSPIKEEFKRLNYDHLIFKAAIL